MFNIQVLGGDGFFTIEPEHIKVTALPSKPFVILNLFSFVIANPRH